MKKNRCLLAALLVLSLCALLLSGCAASASDQQEESAPPAEEQTPPAEQETSEEPTLSGISSLAAVSRHSSRPPGSQE